MRQAVDIPLPPSKIMNNAVTIPSIYVSAVKQDNCVVTYPLCKTGVKKIMGQRQDSLTQQRAGEVQGGGMHCREPVSSR